MPAGHLIKAKFHEIELVGDPLCDLFSISLVRICQRPDGHRQAVPTNCQLLKRFSFKFWEIIDNISKMMQYRDIVTMED